MTGPSMHDTVTNDAIDAALRSLGDVPGEAPALGGDLEAELGTLAPVKPRRPLRRFVGFTALSLLYGAFILSQSSSLREDLHELSLAILVGYGLVWLAGFAALAWIALVPAGSAIMPNWRQLGIGAVVAVVGYLVGNILIATEAAHWPGDLAGYVDDGGGCLQLGLIAAILPIMVSARLVRGSIPVGSRWAGAALGAGAGALGGLVLHLYCDVGNPVHLGLYHGGLVAITTILGALIIPRVSELGRS